MKDTEANVRLIKQVYKHVEQFLDENNPEDFETIEQMERSFSHFLDEKTRAA